MYARVSAAFGCDCATDIVHSEAGYVFDKKIFTSMRGLKELFSDPTLATRASFRSSTEEPSDIAIDRRSAIAASSAKARDGVSGQHIRIPPEKV